jgi:hypothetical protein
VPDTTATVSAPVGTFWHSFADMAAVESGGELVI